VNRESLISVLLKKEPKTAPPLFAVLFVKLLYFSYRELVKLILIYQMPPPYLALLLVN
jgi:hypothetical protein